MSVQKKDSLEEEHGWNKKPPKQNIVSSCHAMSPLDQGKLDNIRFGPLSCPIPNNEPDRLFHLHESKLIDTAHDPDPMFDRFTGLVQRMFKTRFAFVNLIDTDKLVMKSTMGWPAGFPLEQPRKSFCSYVVMSDCSDIFVVEDTTLDARFKQWRLVSTPPFIRFYAGTPLVITTESSQYKIGTLCVLDTVARTGTFTQEDRMNLLDLGAAVSFLVQERYEQARNHAKEVAEMVLDVMQNVRDPLHSINTITHDMIHNNHHNNQQLRDSDTPLPMNNNNINMGHNDPHEQPSTAAAAPTLTATTPTAPNTAIAHHSKATALDNLACAVDHLRHAVECNIRFGEFFLERAETTHATGSGFALCDALVIINDAIKTVSRMKARASLAYPSLRHTSNLTEPNYNPSHHCAGCCCCRRGHMDPPRPVVNQQGHGLHHLAESRFVRVDASHRATVAAGVDNHSRTH